MDDAVQELFAGNDRHVEQIGDALDTLQDVQRPNVVTVCCGDSRVLQDGMWDNTEPGRVFTHSNIGNRVRQRTDTGPVVSGDVLYPLVHTGTGTAIVVGHTGCGAVTATYRSFTDGRSEPAGIDYCLRLLERNLESGFELLPEDADDDEAVNRLVEYNVDRQVEHVVESDEVPETVTTLGVVYDFHDVYSASRGAVHLVNADGIRKTESLRERYPALADRVQRLWEY